MNTIPPTDLEIMAFADRELNFAQSRVVEEWIMAHPADFAKVETIRWMGKQIQELPASKEDFTEAIISRIVASEEINTILSKEVSNDNSRRKFLIFAAAAILFLSFGMLKQNVGSWMNGKETTSIPSLSLKGYGFGLTPVLLPQNSVELGELENSTAEVSNIDFGSQMGSIFYIPKDSSQSSTTVIWMNDSKDVSP